MPFPLRQTAGFGKRIQYWIIGQMLKEGLGVYMPLVEDNSIDAAIQLSDGSFPTVQINTRSKNVAMGNAAPFAAIHPERQGNYWFIFYSDRRERMWIISSAEFLKESALNRTGKNKGKRSIWLNGTYTDRNTGKKIEHSKQQFEKHLTYDFKRSIESGALSSGANLCRRLNRSV